jgi:IS30 family transposase
MGCYRHLTRDDREEIAVLRAAGRSMRAIAAAP